MKVSSAPILLLSGAVLTAASPLDLSKIGSEISDVLKTNTSATTAAPKTTAAPTVCNGHAEYCGRIYSNVSQIASHDSAFVGDLPQQNQKWSVTDQLNHGVRFLTAQSHKNVLGELDLCHTSCWEEDAGSLSSYLSTLKSWLDGNPNEVLTLLLTNGDNLNMSMFDSSFTTAGIKDYTYVPPNSPAVLAIDQWPTLGDMISSGKRLVVFMDYGATPKTYPYILDEFSYFFETPFDTTDPNFAQCKIDRPPNASQNGRMIAVNHNLDVDILGVLVPDVDHITETNAATGNPSSIMKQSGLCAGLYGRWPKAVLLDYVDSGNWTQAELIMNGLLPNS